MITKLHTACQILPPCNSSGFTTAPLASSLLLNPLSLLPQPQPGVWPETLFMNICSMLNIPYPPPWWKGSGPFDLKINMPTQRLWTHRFIPSWAGPHQADGLGLDRVRQRKQNINLFQSNEKVTVVKVHKHQPSLTEKWTQIRCTSKTMVASLVV